MPPTSDATQFTAINSPTIERISVSSPTPSTIDRWLDDNLSPWMTPTSPAGWSGFATCDTSPGQSNPVGRASDAPPPCGSDQALLRKKQDTFCPVPSPEMCLWCQEEDQMGLTATRTTSENTLLSPCSCGSIYGGAPLSGTINPAAVMQSPSAFGASLASSDGTIDWDQEPFRMANGAGDPGSTGSFSLTPLNSPSPGGIEHVLPSVKKAGRNAAGSKTLGSRSPQTGRMQKQQRMAGVKRMPNKGPIKKSSQPHGLLQLHTSM